MYKHIDANKMVPGYLNSYQRGTYWWITVSGTENVDRVVAAMNAYDLNSPDAKVQGVEWVRDTSEDGNEHLHLLVHMKTQCYWSTVVKELKIEKGSASQALVAGDVQAKRKYMKDKGLQVNSWGTFSRYTADSTVQRMSAGGSAGAGDSTVSRSSSGYKEALSLAQGPTPMQTIALQYPEAFAMHEKKLKSLRQVYLCSRPARPAREMRVVCLFGPAGTGKTARVELLTKDLMRDGARTYWMKPTVDGKVWFDLYDGEEIIVIDEAGDRLKRDDFLQLTDIWVQKFDWEVKGGKTKIAPKIIIFTSNYSPDYWWEPRRREQADMSEMQIKNQAEGKRAKMRRFTDLLNVREWGTIPIMINRQYMDPAVRKTMYAQLLQEEREFEVACTQAGATKSSELAKIVVHFVADFVRSQQEWVDGIRTALTDTFDQEDVSPMKVILPPALLAKMNMARQNSGGVEPQTPERRPSMQCPPLKRTKTPCKLNMDFFMGKHVKMCEESVNESFGKTRVFHYAGDAYYRLKSGGIDHLLIGVDSLKLDGITSESMKELFKNAVGEFGQRGCPVDPELFDELHEKFERLFDGRRWTFEMEVDWRLFVLYVKTDEEPQDYWDAEGSEFAKWLEKRILKERFEWKSWNGFPELPKVPALAPASPRFSDSSTLDEDESEDSEDLESIRAVTTEHI